MELTITNNINLMDNLNKIQEKYLDTYYIKNDELYQEKINQIKKSFFPTHVTQRRFMSKEKINKFVTLDLLENQYLTSIRSEKIGLIKNITLNIGGSAIDKLNYKIIPTLQRLFNFQSNELPFLITKDFICGTKHHKVDLIIEYSEEEIEDMIEFDCYTGDNHEELEYNLLRCQYCGEEENNSKFKIKQNHCTPYLLIEDTFEEDPILYLDGTKYQLQHQTIINNYRIYDLTYQQKNQFGINFSKVDKPYLFFKETLPKFNLFTLSRQPIRKVMGLMGLTLGD